MAIGSSVFKSLSTLNAEKSLQSKTQAKTLVSCLTVPPRSRNPARVSQSSYLDTHSSVARSKHKTGMSVTRVPPDLVQHSQDLSPASHPIRLEFVFDYFSSAASTIMAKKGIEKQALLYWKKPQGLLGFGEP
ncbi:uncharacterized protein ColSpa_06842 [Colletotrichum spaethianum]|uniref:Uncharacterized protein n=1 Tax=Colletotrichum spaethianum TaxID=700344 RepID=A0AA37LDJ1_9PEZI|nr:uncharacterized protein ColSpa_06842 [Colletotrichum spaethianum]GKT46661.1 hypothetical protein ColSpa_06842 [Colletotrichum spaethianum]